MLNTGTFLAFYAAVLAIQLSPGPDMVLVIGREIGQGPPDRHSDGGWYDPHIWLHPDRAVGSRRGVDPSGLAARLRYCAMARRSLSDWLGVKLLIRVRSSGGYGP